MQEKLFVERRIPGLHTYMRIHTFNTGNINHLTDLPAMKFYNDVEKSKTTGLQRQ